MIRLYHSRWTYLDEPNKYICFLDVDQGELETHLHEPCDEDHEAFPEDFYSEASLYARPPKLTIPPEGDYQGYAPSPLDDAYHYGIYAETGTAPMPGVGNYTTGSYSYPATSSPYDPPPMPTIPSPYYHSSGGGFSPTVSPAVDHMSMQSPWEGGHSQVVQSLQRDIAPLYS